MSATVFLVATLVVQTASPIEILDVGDTAVVLHTPEPYRGILVGNSTLVRGETGSILIDTGIRERAEALRSVIDSLDFPPIRQVVNTHSHLDHIGGNAAFSRIAPSSEGPRLPATVMRSLPTLHSVQDLVFYFPVPNVLVLGDIFPGRGYPALDVDEGATVDGLIETLDWALAQGDEETTVVPGHGRLETTSDLDEFRTMVSTVVERVRASIAEAVTEDEVVAQKPSREFDAKWGDGFLPPDAWVGQLYRMLARG